MFFVHPPIIYFGIVWGGVIGAAFGINDHFLAPSIFGYFLCIKPQIGKCLQEYSTAVFPALFISLIMGMTLLVSKHFVFDQGLIEMVVQIFFGGALYFGLNTLLRRDFMVSNFRMLFLKSAAISNE